MLLKMLFKFKPPASRSVSACVSVCLSPGVLLFKLKLPASLSVSRSVSRGLCMFCVCVCVLFKFTQPGCPVPAMLAQRLALACVAGGADV